MYRFANIKEAYEESRKYHAKGEVVDFPPYVTFQLTNACNYRCIMCHRPYMKEKARELDFASFVRAVDEIARYGSLIRFIGYGEPFLYSRIADAIRYVKDKGILLHITTNGSLLDDSSITDMVENGVDSVIFSFQGLSRKEFCFMRRVSDEGYRKVVRNIESLFGRRKNGKPYMKITTTVTDRDEASGKDEFIRTALQCVDEVQITGHTHLVHLDEQFGDAGIWERAAVRKPEEVDGVTCFVANYEMLVDESGDVSLCCGAFSDDLAVGNISSGTLYDIWHSERARGFREAVSDGRLKKFKDCSFCPIRYSYRNTPSTVMNTQDGKAERYFRAR